MLKGRQTGSMHRGHAWVFRAETHETMLAWFNDVKELTEKRGEERNEFVRRQHARSLSGNSLKPASIISSDGALEEDEADRIAFAGEQSVRGNSVSDGAVIGGVDGLGAVPGHDLDDNRSDVGWRPPQQRPAPGGRFPSDVNVQRGLQAPLSPSSGESSDRDRDIIAAAGALPGSGLPFANTFERHTELQPEASALANGSQSQIHHTADSHSPTQYSSGEHHNIVVTTHGTVPSHGSGSQYGEWMAPIAAGTAGAAGAAVGAGVMHHHHQQQHPPLAEPAKSEMDNAIPQYGQSSPPIPVATAVPIDAPTGPRALSETTTAPSSAVGNTASSNTETATLSTVPTSTGYPSQNESMFNSNGGFVGSKAVSSTQPDYLPNPTERSKSHSTISDFHIPGEFPPTPALHEEKRLEAPQK